MGTKEKFWLALSLGVFTASVGLWFLWKKTEVPSFQIPNIDGFCKINLEQIPSEGTALSLTVEQDQELLAVLIPCSEQNETPRVSEYFKFAVSKKKVYGQLTRAEFIKQTQIPVARIQQGEKMKLVRGSDEVPENYQPEIPNLLFNSQGVDEYAAYQATYVDLSGANPSSYWNIYATSLIGQQIAYLIYYGPSNRLAKVKDIIRVWLIGNQ